MDIILHDTITKSVLRLPLSMVLSSVDFLKHNIKLVPSKFFFFINID